MSLNLPQALHTLVAALGMAVFLYLMWRTPHGVPGLRAIDPNFQLPDMRFHYTRAQLATTLDGLGPEGRGKLLRFWLMDVGFILCFGLVMWMASLSVSALPLVRTLMLACTLARALLDLLENLLLAIVCRRYPSPMPRLATLCGYVTSCKFIALFAWVAGLFLTLFLRAFHLV